MNSKLLKNVLFVFKIVFIIALFVWIGFKFDYKSARLLLASASPGWAVTAVIFAVVSYWFVTLRWKTIIKGFWPAPKSSLSQLVAYNLLGVFYTLFLPTSIAGEAVRLWKLAKNEDNDYGKAAMTAIIDRVIGVTTWFMLFLVLPSKLPKNKLLLLVLLIPIALYLFKDKIVIKEKKIFDFSRHHPADIFKSVVFSVFCQIFSCLMGYAIIRCLNIDMNVFLACGVVAAGALVSLIPVSMLGFGVREGFFVATLPAYGASPTEAVLVTTFVVFITYLTGLSGGIIELMNTGWNLSSLKPKDIKEENNGKN
jgi:glycosyltransferase 2 family protein